MSITVCLAPARTIRYPQGGGHLWVYLQWALGLRALGCRVIWLEGLDPRARGVRAPRRLIAGLKSRLQPFGLSESVALFSADGGPLPRELAQDSLDLDAAAEADLLVNLWHSLPAAVVRRFRRTAFVDTDPGRLQIWMTNRFLRVAPHQIYFTIGETVGTPAARFPDCGLRWHYTPPAVFLPEWPPARADSSAPYTTVAHWWGGKIRFRSETISNDKRVAFLKFAQLPSRTSAKLEMAICLGSRYEQWRGRLESLGWTIREAWEVAATPGQYRSYIQRSRGEFGCANPACVHLANAWISDRTLCYLASGKPAIVEDTGPSRILPEAEGLFRFRSLDDAVRALAAVESDYGRHARLARALAEEHFDAQKVAARVLEQALAWPRRRSRAGNAQRGTSIVPAEARRR